MPSGISEGLIYLIPKGDEVSLDLKKWRPITLLNTTYKILAKALENRLQKVLDVIIYDSQTRFLQERSIMDNIFVFWEMTALAKTMKQDLVVLFLDFEKAYDRVDWMFLQQVMGKMGFQHIWIEGTTATYQEATSQVLVIGENGPWFTISRSV
jgi:hypothetical protein